MKTRMHTLHAATAMALCFNLNLAGATWQTVDDFQVAPGFSASSGDIGTGMASSAPVCRSLMFATQLIRAALGGTTPSEAAAL